MLSHLKTPALKRDSQINKEVMVPKKFIMTAQKSVKPVKTVKQTVWTAFQRKQADRMLSNILTGF